MTKPDWLKIRPPTSKKFEEIKEIVKDIHLHTVCQESHCPNMSECWSGGTATFMVLGDTCTRACKFCNVKTKFPAHPPDETEPQKIADTLKKWKLDYIVITSVDRDDLSDQGSGHFAKCIQEAKNVNPKLLIEVLIPDFRGDENCLDTVIKAKPDVIAHNLETVKSLQNKVRDPRASYDQSLRVLEHIKKKNPDIHTKSSLMLGLGETDAEVIRAMRDLRKIGVSFLTLGQYLRPSMKNLPVVEYVHPEKFEYFKEIGEDLGFLYVASGPLVRSSYRAGEFFIKSVIGREHKHTHS